MKRSVATSSSTTSSSHLSSQPGSHSHPPTSSLPVTVSDSPSPSPPRSPTKPPASSLLHSLSINPYVVYPFALLLFLSFHICVSFAFTGTAHYGLLSSSQPPPRVFTPSELSTFDGVQSPSIYLAILGDVFDVTSGAKYYGPDGGYHAFAGKDGSRAFITGCFDTGAVPDIRGLKDREVVALEKWRDFYRDHKTYRRMGTVANPPIADDAPLPNDDCK